MGEQKVKTIEGSSDAAAAPVKRAAKKSKRQVQSGRIYIRSSYNNTIVTVTDQAGGVLVWGSAGLAGFKGSKKSTPYAAQRIIEDLVGKMKNLGFQEAEIYIRGIGSGRESAVRALLSAGIKVSSIKDLTPVPHGGVRPKKPRRV